MTAREMQMEFERRIQLMNPAFELKEKVTSDTIFSFLNAYTERYVRNNYLQEDTVQDGTRAQKKNADSLKGLIVRGLFNVAAQDESNTDMTTDKVVLPKDYFLYIRSNSVISSCYKGAVSKFDKYRSEIELKEQDTTNKEIVYTIKYTYDKANNVYKYKAKSVVDGVVVEAETESTISVTKLAEKVNVYNHDHMIITPNKTIREDDVEKIISTYYNKAIILNPYVVLNKGQREDNTTDLYLNIIHDTYTTVNQIDLVYYRKPRKFDVIGVDDETVLGYCELPENVHMEIVEGAVEMFITEAKYRLAGTGDRRRNNED
jgi:hypothetical protein